MKTIPFYPLERLQQNGLKLGDQITIRPIQGHQQVKKLLRTKVEFFSSTHEERVQSQQRKRQEKLLGYQFLLPSLTSHPFHCRLTLTPYLDFDRPKICGYRIQSLTEYPFRLNGVHVFDAFLERGDTLQLGQNYLSFSAYTHHDEKEKITVSLPLLNPPYLTLDELKKTYTAQIYNHCDQNIDLTATVLKLNKKTVQKLIRS